MGEQEKNVETDKQLKRIQDEIIASIEGIYQSIENIGKVNKEVLPAKDSFVAFWAFNNM